MTNKKSLYQILEVPTDATYPEIGASHERLLQSLERQQSLLSREDYTLQLRLLKVAYSTLSTPMSRDSYDAHLTTRNEPTKPNLASLVTTSIATSNAAAIRADALLMRADAMALRADALGLKADLWSGQPTGNGGATGSPVVSRLLSGFKTALLTLGTLAALGMVIKVVFLFAMTRQPEAIGTQSKSDDKLFLQEYFQTYGVRPASRAEADLMDAERRKNEEAKRAQKLLEDDKKKTARAELDFEEEARRRGQQVSTELQYAEERARQAQLQEAQQKEYEKRMNAESERMRIEAEKAQWKNVLRTSSSD